MSPEDIISTHTVHSQIECSWRCLHVSTCVGYNYKTELSKHAVNCQLSKKPIDKENHGNGNWTFYQDLKTVSTKSEEERQTYACLTDVDTYLIRT